jgi:hypothetical protein
MSLHADTDESRVQSSCRGSRTVRGAGQRGRSRTRNVSARSPLCRAARQGRGAFRSIRMHRQMGVNCCAKIEGAGHPDDAGDERAQMARRFRGRGPGSGAAHREPQRTPRQRSLPAAPRQRSRAGNRQYTLDQGGRFVTDETSAGEPRVRGARARSEPRANSRQLQPGSHHAGRSGGGPEQNHVKYRLVDSQLGPDGLRPADADGRERQDQINKGRQGASPRSDHNK